MGTHQSQSIHMDLDGETGNLGPKFEAVCNAVCDQRKCITTSPTSRMAPHSSSVSQTRPSNTDTKSFSKRKVVHDDLQSTKKKKTSNEASSITLDIDNFDECEIESVLPSTRLFPILDDKRTMKSNAMSNTMREELSTLKDLIINLVNVDLGWQTFTEEDLKEVECFKRTRVTKKARNEKRTGTKHRQLDLSKPPISDIYDIFEDMSKKALENNFEKACTPFRTRPLNVFTMCSGTEAPILAMKLLQKTLKRQGHDFFKFSHVASAEIEPRKQAYIQRNFGPPILFRDVTEFKTAAKNADIHTAYGYTAPRPRNVDILIAGSSCVDYSTLNKRPKEFGQKGESFNTLAGIKTYAEDCQPAIVILENVKTAPWKSIQQYWESIGYVCQVVFVDTKNFYLPQTRLRGYMFAIHAKKAESAGLENSRKAADLWVKIMRTFQRRASSPFSDFIFSDDDPQLQHDMHALAAISTQQNEKSQDWSACRHRHSGFRALKKLGAERPYTRWQNNGSCNFVDNGAQQWMLFQRERIWDTLDINYLSGVSERDYCISDKEREIDLSQNCDRDCDSRPWGICGCITPSGIPFSTRRGGPLTGREILALQGIPINDLILSNENSRQLQDLAGNAMSSTVVGAAVVSAIIAGTIWKSPGLHQHFNGSIFAGSTDLNDCIDNPAVPDNLVPNGLDLNNVLQYANARNLLPKTKTLGVSEPRTVHHLAELAKSSLRLCSCEGLVDRKEGRFQICIECGHATCYKCGSNPSHKYEELPLNFVANRVQPRDFMKAITAALPRSVLITQAGTLDFEKILGPTGSENELSDCHHALKKALSDVLYFQQVKRGNAWNISYEGSHSRLELHFGPRVYKSPFDMQEYLSSEVKFCWLLFAKPEKSLPASSRVRKVFKHPIGRMTPSSDLFTGNWQFRIPYRQPEFNLKVSGCGNRVPSWESIIGLQHEMFRDRKVYDEVEISLDEHEKQGEQQALKAICGRYKLLPNCGGSCGSLHRRVEAQDATMFLFLDPHALGPATNDAFVFSTDHFKMAPNHPRLTVARLEVGWRLKEDESTWSVKCTLEDRWFDCESFRISPQEVSINVWEPTLLEDVISQQTSCSNGARTILLSQFPLNKNQQRLWPPKHRHSVQLINQPSALQEFAWILPRICHIDAEEHWHQFKLSQNISKCVTCSPEEPELTWSWVRKQRSKAWQIRPFENPQQLSHFEKCLRTRPDPVSATMHCQDGYALLEIGLNIDTLVHRIIPIMGIHDSKDIVHCRVQWRLCSDDGLHYQPPFTPPVLRSNSQDDSRGLSGDRHTRNPASVKSDESKSRTGYVINRELWTAQKKALFWMQQQEDHPPKWEEREREEIRLPSLGLRLDLEVEKSSSIRGGILADEVGAGKTTTSLALIAQDLILHQPTVLTYRTGQSQIPISATLILVPNNIMPQWFKEINACLDVTRVSVLAISHFKDLRNTTVEQFQDADIVLAPWTLFDDEAYWTDLGKVCWALNSPPVAGRPFNHWIDKALKTLYDLVRASNGCQDHKSFWARRTEEKANLAVYKQFAGFQTRKDDNWLSHKNGIVSDINACHLKDTDLGAVDDQAAYPDAHHESNWSLSEMIKALAAWPEHPEDEPIPVFLHMFRFKRLIVDEFTYLNGKSLAAIQRIKAVCRWMLSGTPPLADFDSINTMAKLLGTKIATAHEKHGGFRHKAFISRTMKEKSYVEEFRDLQVHRTSAWTIRRNEKVIEFATTFIRQNPANLDSISRKDIYCVVDFSVLELAVYLEVYQHLMSHNVKFNKKYSLTALRTMSRQQRILAAISKSSSPEAALLCCNSEMRGMEGAALRVSSALGQCKLIADEKETKFKEICQMILLDLQEAWWYKAQAPNETTEDNPHFNVYLSNIIGHRMGDMVTTELLKGMIVFSQKNPKAFSELRSKGGPTEDEAINQANEEQDESGNVPLTPLVHRRSEMANRATTLNNLTLDLIGIVRTTRLFRLIEKIVQNAKLPDCCSCGKSEGNLEMLYVLGLCGHLVCRNCYHDDLRLSTNPDGCPGYGCSSSALPQHLIPAQIFGPEQTSDVTYLGSKMDGVVKTIKSIESRDYILIFVQYDIIKTHLLEALDKSGILYKDGTTKSAGGRIEAYIQLVRAEQQLRQGDKGGNKTHAHVLVLMIDSPDAAGWNLQFANHVMFVCPFVARNNYDYNATMTQAVGRARRFGQQQTVYVYHFVTARTNEVAILQDRMAKKLVRRGNKFELVESSELLDTDEDWGAMKIEGAATAAASYQET